MLDDRLIETGQRGTALWAFRRLKEDALTALLDDLLEAEKRGLNDSQCDAIKLSIGYMVNHASSIPDGSFFATATWQVLEQFKDTYYLWNDPKGLENEKVIHRSNKLKDLRRLRHKLAKKVRKHGHKLEKDLDLQLIDDTYEALGDAAKAGPEIFRELAKAVARFSKRKLG